MIKTVTGRRYVTRARQYHAKFFCNTITPRNTCNAITSLPKTQKYSIILSYLRDSVIWVYSLHPKHPKQTSFPDRKISPIRKTEIDPPSRVCNRRRPE